MNLLASSSNWSPENHENFEIEVKKIIEPVPSKQRTSVRLVCDGGTVGSMDRDASESPPGDAIVWKPRKGSFNGF